MSPGQTVFRLPGGRSLFPDDNAQPPGQLSGLPAIHDDAPELLPGIREDQLLQAAGGEIHPPSGVWKKRTPVRLHSEYATPFHTQEAMEA